jgi:hypothetical protein
VTPGDLIECAQERWAKARLLAEPVKGRSVFDEKSEIALCLPDDVDRANAGAYALSTISVFAAFAVGLGDCSPTMIVHRHRRHGYANSYRHQGSDEWLLNVAQGFAVGGQTL